MRAAAGGQLDYKEADFDDPLWFAKEALVFNELERECWTKVAETAHTQLLALLSTNIPDQSGFDTISSVLERQLHVLGHEYLPWEKWALTDQDRGELREAKGKKYQEDYEKAFGSVGGVRVRESEKKAKLYLLCSKLSARAKRENREFTPAQQNWIDAARKAIDGDKVAWKKVADVDQAGLVKLFSTTFNRRDVIEDVEAELGEAS